MLLRRLILSVAVAFLHGHEAPAASESEVAYVTSLVGEVRSGPGKHFYVTSRLSRGDRVEIYRRDEEGWAAVRPPTGSFSLVRTADIRIAPDGETATVIAPETQTRIGSTTSSKRNAAYVRLRKGERVRLLDPRPPSATPGPSPPKRAWEEWTRIHPPAGEFRWIALSVLAESPPDDAMQKSPPRDEADPTDAVANDSSDRVDDWEAADGDQAIRDGNVQPAQWSYDLAPRTYADSTKNWEPVESEGSGNRGGGPTGPLGGLRRAVESLLPGGRAPVRVAAAPLPSRRGSSPSSADPESGWFTTPTVEARPPATSTRDSLAIDTTSDRALDISRRSPLEAGNATGGMDALGGIRVDCPQPAKPEVLRQELNQVAAELSLAITHPASTWQLAPLQGRAQAVIDASDVPDLRQDAQALLARIAQFEDLQRRTRQFDRRFLASQRGTGGSAKGELAANAASSTPAGPQVPPLNVTRYDGHGWLMPVLTPVKGRPQHVLMDAQGNIVQFVSPSPGMNLRPYENRRVGVYGQPGFLHDVEQPHLVAERIVTLDRMR